MKRVHGVLALVEDGEVLHVLSSDDYNFLYPAVFNLLDASDFRKYTDTDTAKENGISALVEDVRNRALDTEYEALLLYASDDLLYEAIRVMWEDLV